MLNELVELGSAEHELKKIAKASTVEKHLAIFLLIFCRQSRQGNESPLARVGGKEFKNKSLGALDCAIVLIFILIYHLRKFGIGGSSL